MKRNIAGLLRWAWAPLLAAIAVGALAHTLVERYVLESARRDVQDMLLAQRAVHHYIQRNMHPEYYRARADGEIAEDYYSPELLSSSYMVRVLADYLNEERRTLGLPEVYYKMAADNPRNPVNAADPDEARLLAYFRAHPQVQEYSDVEEVRGTEELVVAMPFLRTNGACLTCHGHREDAPPGLQARYAGQGGFNEHVGELRAIESIRVPIERESTAVWVATFGILAGLSGFGLLFVFNRTLSTRVKDRTAALSTSEQRWQFALEGAGDGLWDWEVPSGRCYYSLQWKAMLGYAAGDVGDRIEAWRSRVHPDDLPKAEAALERHFRRETRVYEAEIRMRCKDGTYKWILDRGKVLEWREDGRPVRMIGTHRDIDDRKRAQAERQRLEEQLFQSQKMETIGTLAGGVAHDFNNMLSVIISHAELGRADLGPDEPVRQDLEEILAAARRSADLTRQLLAFARKQAVKPRVLDPNEAVEAVLKMLRRLIGEDVELVWRPGRDVWKIRIDPSQLDQILANLAVNARDAIDGPGTLTLATENVVLGPDPDGAEGVTGEFVRLTVSDTGAGMDDAVRARAFEPFFTTKGVGEGTGLGLATVYGIVKQNEGFVHLESAPGEGTRVRILLPRCAEASSDAERREPAAAVGGDETLLLVEDDPAIRRALRRILVGAGYTVHTAGDPEEALALAGGHSVALDLVVTDVVMPKMNGRELVERLRSDRPGLRALFVSGYPAGVLAPHGVIEKGLHFVQKPLGREALLAAVRSALDAAEPGAAGSSGGTA